VYNIYESIPPLDTTWYTIWAKVIVIVATYRGVVTVGVECFSFRPHDCGGFLSSWYSGLSSIVSTHSTKAL